MLALRVNDDVMLVILGDFAAVDLVVLPAFGGKADGGVGHPGSVVRVGKPVHVVIHFVISLCPVRITEHAAEAFGKCKRNHPLIDKLINGKGDGRRLHIGENLGVEPVTLHAGVLL